MVFSPEKKVDRLAAANPVDSIFQIGDPVNLLTRIEERDELDYKEELNDTHKGKADFLKDCSAIANNGGGVLVFGVRDRDLVGVKEQELQHYDPSRLHDRVKAHLSPIPRITTEIVRQDGKQFPFVKIAGIGNAPILIAKNFHDEKNNQLLREGQIYIRQNTKTILVHTEAQIRHVLERVIIHEVRDRLSVIRPILSEGHPTHERDPTVEMDAKTKAEEHVAIFPDTPRREALLVSKVAGSKRASTDLKSAFGLKVELHGHSYPHYDVYSPLSKISRLQDGFIGWHKSGADEWRCIGRQTEDGGLFWMASLFEDEIVALGEPDSKKFKNAIGVMVTHYYVVMALAHAREYMKALSSNEVWTLTYRLRNIGGRHLVVEEFSRMGFQSRKVSVDSDIEVKCDMKLADLERDLPSLAKYFLRELYERFNWPNVDEAQLNKDVDQTLRKLVVKTITF